MTSSTVFLACVPGLEAVVADEARAEGFRVQAETSGGVEVEGGWPQAWRANLVLRTPGRVLVRVAAFHSTHLAHLDKQARAAAWAQWFAPGTPLRVDAACRKSRLNHAGAVAQRIADAAAAKAKTVAATGDQALTVLVRVDHDHVVVSLDASGAPLHKRGHKTAVAAAPLRETLAAAFLRIAGWSPGDALLDPMCGSGTFALEAAERAAGLAPGRGRSFAFERLRTFDADRYAALRAERAAQAKPPPDAPVAWGSDRDASVLAMARANAERANVTAWTAFARTPVATVRPPDAEPGLVIVNPPYGARLGDRAAVRSLHQTLGRVLRERFSGWRVALLTNREELAKATRLPVVAATDPIPHGALRVRLYVSEPL